MYKIIIRALFLATLVVGSYADTEPVCEPPHIPLYTVYEVVPNFPTTDFCQRTCYSKYWMAEGNVRHVTFTGKLKEGECPSALCQCMYDYMNQGDWLVDVCPICFVKCNKVTLELSGKPDPTWDPTKVDTSLDRPLEKLQAVLAQFKNKADLAGLVCTTRSEVDKCGCIHVMLECPLHGDKRCQDEICTIIWNYFNQGNNLKDSHHLCNIRECDDVFEIEFIGNAKEGQNCLPIPVLITGKN